MRTRLIGAIVVVLTMCAIGCGGPKNGGDLRPDSSAFSSEWVEISMGGMMAVPGEGPALTLNLKNATREPLWVEVEFKTPGSINECVVDKKLDVGGGGMFVCAQGSLVEDEDYPVLVRTYRDAQHSELLESKQTHFRFSGEDVVRFNELVEAMRAAQK